MFGRHQTYHLREHWVVKGLAAVGQAEAEGVSGNVFLRSDAPERFGMGPGMIRALHFWLLACGLAFETSKESRRQGGLSPSLTDFGRIVWTCDPYLERLETVWFLHLHLARNKVHVPAWFWFFNSFVSSRPFDEPTCLDALHCWVITSYPKNIVKRTTLHKDLMCLLRMYYSGRQATSPEDSAVSPFARLCLLTYTQDGHQRQYHLVPPDPERFHPLVLLYALISQQVQVRSQSSLVSLTAVLYEPGNVGRVFSLFTHNRLLDVLMRIRDSNEEWSVSLTRHGEQECLSLPTCSPEQVLLHSYQKG